MKLFFAVSGIALVWLSISLGVFSSAFLILILGITMLSGLFLPPVPQKSLATVFGVVSTLFSAYIFLVNPDFFGTVFSPFQGTLMFVLGMCGFLAAFHTDRVAG
jgi:hypothetical protein